MSASNLTFDLHEYDEVASTNDIVRDVISAGLHEGFVACARRQIGGYGRRGHCWVSPEGGLYISFLLEPNRPAAEMPTLSMVASLAVCRAIDGFLPADSRNRAEVKWPNDVVVVGADRPSDGRFWKICGVSAEKIGRAVCLGVGVNVLHPRDGAAELGASELQLDEVEGGKNDVAFLEDVADSVEVEGGLTVELFRDAFLSEFERLYGQWQRFGMAAVVSALNERFALKGHEVVVSLGDAARADAAIGGAHSGAATQEKRGKALGVADDGALLLAGSAAGEIERIYDGTVSLS